MANETILIVDADEKSQRVLEVSFKKAGYRVVMTDSVIQALEYVHAARPDIIISDTQFTDGTDGFDFIEAVKADPATLHIPFLFLTEERALDQKMRGFEAGADDYLTKPVYIKEVTTRVDLLLQKRAKQILDDAESDEVTGELSDITMIDLLQMIEKSGRSGSINLTRDDRTGVVTFRDGNILDAMCGKLQGEEAIYRLMLWPDGEFVVRYHDEVGQVDRIDKESGELLLEGIRRLERWNDQVRHLPPIGSTLEADFAELARAIDQLPAEVARVARLFDGVRTIRDVVDDSPFDDVTTLQITRRLLDDGILRNVTPEEAAPEATAPANLSSWLKGQDNVRERTDTSPGRTATTAGNERPRRETKQLDDDPWARRKTERLDQNSEVTGPTDAASDRSTDMGLTTRTSETPAARASEVDEVPEAAGTGDESSDSWQFHFEDADDAIRAIEENERKRRELEAQQLHSGGTLQQTPAIDRESGETKAVQADTDTDQLPSARVEETASADARPEIDATPSADLSELEEAERKRREVEAETLERQRKLAEEARQRLMDGSPRLPGASTETAARPETPATGLPAAEPDVEEETLEPRQTDEIEDLSEQDDRRRRRQPTPISAPALVSSEPVSLDDEEERPRTETPLEPTPTEQREAAVDEAEAVAREASEDVRQSAPHAAVDMSEPVEEPTEQERSVADGLGDEVSEADAFLDDEELSTEPPEDPASTSGPYDEVVAVSAFESGEVDESVDSTERVTKRMRPPNFSQMTPLGEEVSEPVVGEEDGLEESTAPGEYDPDEIEASLELLPPIDRHSQDNEVVTATYDLTEISARRRAMNTRQDESPEARKARIEEAAERAAANAIRATTGLDPEDFVGEVPLDDPDSSTEVWTNPEMMDRIDEIADAWSGADSDVVETDTEYDLIDVSGEDDTLDIPTEQETIDIAEDDTDPPVAGESDEEDEEDDDIVAAAAAAAAEVADLETVELDEDEKAGEVVAPDEGEEEEAEEAGEGEAEAEEAEGEEETSTAVADHSSEVDFFSEDYQPDEHAYEDEGDDNRKVFLGVSAILMFIVLGLIAIIATSDSETDEVDEPETTVAETTPVETTTVETTPVETTPTEVAGLDTDEATIEAELNGVDVETSATEVSMLLAGIDPLMAPDAGLAAVPDAGMGELAVNSETTPSEAETTPDEVTEPKPEKKDPLREAERLVNREQFNDAIAMLEDLAKSQPKNGRVAYLHGLAAVSVGRENEAIKQFERSKSLGYRPSRLFLELGGAYFIAGNKPKAKAAYEAFLEKQPNGNEADQVRTILQTQF